MFESPEGILGESIMRELPEVMSGEDFPMSVVLRQSNERV